MTEPNTEHRIDHGDYVTINTEIQGGFYAGQFAYVRITHYPINVNNNRLYNLRVFTEGDTTTPASYQDEPCSFSETDLLFCNKNAVPEKIRRLQEALNEHIDEVSSAAHSTVPTQSTVIDFCDEFKALIQRN